MIHKIEAIWAILRGKGVLYRAKLAVDIDKDGSASLVISPNILILETTINTPL